MTKEIPKLIQDGKVAVLVSPGYGAGWSTWHRSGGGNMVFCPEMAQAILNNASEEQIEEIAEKLFPKTYLGALRDIEVQWLPVGTRFRIHEYDGSERIVTEEDEDWFMA